MCVKLGFVGCGFMGQIAHLANYATVEGCRLVAIADPKHEQARRVAARYGVEKTYADHVALAADPEVDAVVAILPHTANGPIVKDLLKAGKHVIVEKPLASSAAQAREMAEAAADAGVHLIVGNMKRHDPGVEWARMAVASWDGDPQEPTFVRAHCFGGDWLCGAGASMVRSDEPYPPMRVECTGPEFLDDDGRVAFQTFTNIYIHNINLVRFLLDEELEALSVTSHGTNRVITLAAGKTLVSLECGSMGGQWWDEVTTVYWPNGYVDVKTPPPMLRHVPATVEKYTASDGRKETPVLPWVWSFRAQAQAFVETVRGDREPVNPASEGVRDLEVAEAIFRML